MMPTYGRACTGPWSGPKPCWTCGAYGLASNGRLSNSSASNGKRNASIRTAISSPVRHSLPWQCSGRAVTPEELGAAIGRKEWHRILHHLRFCPPFFPSAVLASLGENPYDAIGSPDSASVFSERGAEFD